MLFPLSCSYFLSLSPSLPLYPSTSLPLPIFSLPPSLLMVFHTSVHPVLHLHIHTHMLTFPSSVPFPTSSTSPSPSVPTFSSSLYIHTFFQTPAHPVTGQGWLLKEGAGCTRHGAHTCTVHDSMYTYSSYTNNSQCTSQDTSTYHALSINISSMSNESFHCMGVSSPSCLHYSSPPQLYSDKVSLGESELQ